MASLVQFLYACMHGLRVSSYNFHVDLVAMSGLENMSGVVG